MHDRSILILTVLGQHRSASFIARVCLDHRFCQAHPIAVLPITLIRVDEASYSLGSSSSPSLDGVATPLMQVGLNALSHCQASAKGEGTREHGCLVNQFANSAP
jgi:hypothetical protein